MIPYFNSYNLLLQEILGKVARIESTLNFFYDNFELYGQGINLFNMEKELEIARLTKEFHTPFMKKNPKISVIIPISRSMEILARAIESVTSQTYDNFELMLVSEVDRPDLRKFLKSKNDKRINLVVDSPRSRVTGKWPNWNHSGGKSRSLGMRMAKGEFFTFLDDDDLMLPDKLKTCLTFAQDNKVEVVGHLEGTKFKNKIIQLRENKVGKVRRYHDSTIEFLGINTNTLFIHKYFLFITWPIFNHKNLRANDQVYIRMLLSSKPVYRLLPEILTLSKLD